MISNVSNLVKEKKIDDISKEKNKNIINVIKGAIIAIILSLIFLTVYAAVLSFTNVSENTMVPVVLVITGISILIGSSMSSISIKKKGLMNGALVGLIYAITLYILSSIFGTGFSIGLNSIIMIIVSIITGMIGGIIGVNLKN